MFSIWTVSSSNSVRKCWILEAFSYMLSTRGIFSMLSTLYRRHHLLHSVYYARSVFILHEVCLKYHLSTLMIVYMLSTGSVFDSTWSIFYMLSTTACLSICCLQEAYSIQHGASSTCCLQLPACLYAVYRKRILCTWRIFYMMSTTACLSTWRGPGA